jgi:hypothetical protein
MTEQQRRAAIQQVVSRMRIYFQSTRAQAASRELVEKWAGEIEQLLKGER